MADTTTVDTLIKKVRVDREWGTNTEIAAFASKIKATVRLIRMVSKIGANDSDQTIRDKD